MEKMITLTIDGVKVEVPQGATVLDAARKAAINIPTLCYLKDMNAIGSCRICVVDAGGRSLQAACVLPAAEGMNVKTNTPAVREARRVNMELLLSNHEKKCLTCSRSGKCELQQLALELDVRDVRFEGEIAHFDVDDSSPSIVRDPKKCILCRRCIAACSRFQSVGCIGASNRGFNTIVESAWGRELGDVNCINCGQCINACPVGALKEKYQVDQVWAAIDDPDKIVVVQPAPSVRVALGEEFGMPMGTRVTGKLAAALRRLGFDLVFDTDFGADMTIVEEATELVDRLQSGGELPMMTSCSPGWVKYIEHNHPEMLGHLSTCKSPHQMLGAAVKTFYAEKNHIDPSKLFVVSVMPCTAKKFEAARPEMQVNGLRDVDVVITTRELARMIRQAGIDFVNLPDEEFDPVMGESSGAGAIFGATGGVMEAALRTAYELITGETLEKVDFDAVRGTAGIKEASVQIGDQTINVAVASGTGNAEKLLQDIKAGKKQYHFVEIMACPGGCVNGGGQPIVSATKRFQGDHRKLRAAAVYAEDQDKPLRKSHKNQELLDMYKEYFGKFGSHMAHEILHTHGYTPRELY